MYFFTPWVPAWCATRRSRGCRGCSLTTCRATCLHNANTRGQRPLAPLHMRVPALSRKQLCLRPACTLPPPRPTYPISPPSLATLSPCPLRILCSGAVHLGASCPRGRPDACVGRVCMAVTHFPHSTNACPPLLRQRHWALGIAVYPFPYEVGTVSLLPFPAREYEPFPQLNGRIVAQFTFFCCLGDRELSPWQPTMHAH